MWHSKKRSLSKCFTCNLEQRYSGKKCTTHSLVDTSKAKNYSKDQKAQKLCTWKWGLFGIPWKDDSETIKKKEGGVSPKLIYLKVKSLRIYELTKCIANVPLLRIGRMYATNMMGKRTVAINEDH